jgi:predicted AAA+ superfamily ATPase
MRKIFLISSEHRQVGKTYLAEMIGKSLGKMSVIHAGTLDVSFNYRNLDCDVLLIELSKFDKPKQFDEIINFANQKYSERREPQKEHTIVKNPHLIITGSDLKGFSEQLKNSNSKTVFNINLDKSW